MDKDTSARRTVDCLQKLFALLLALAAVETFKRLVAVSPATGAVEIKTELLPNFFTTMLVVIPIYHGMHRHLDETYGTPAPRTQRNKMRAFFFFDFVISWAVFALILILQMIVERAFLFFVTLLTITALNVVWGWVMYWLMEKEYIEKWWIVNLLVVVFLFACVGVSYFFSVLDDFIRWAVTIAYFLRTVADYYLCWDTYFPQKD